MPDPSNSELIERAAALLRPRRIGEYTMGNVAAALVSGSGELYTGVCIDLGSSMGFCAEHNAAGSMVTRGEYRVRKVVAVWRNDEDGVLYVAPPCGRCREFLLQLDVQNTDAEVVLGPDRSARLGELLPRPDWAAVPANS